MAWLKHYEVWLIVLAGLVSPGADWSAEAVPAGYRSIASERRITSSVL